MNNQDTRIHVEKPKNKFNRTALNIVMVVTAILVVVFSQLGPEPKEKKTKPPVSSDQNKSQQTTSESANTAINNSTPVKANTNTTLESLSTVPKTPPSEGRHINIQNWSNENGSQVLFVEAHEIPMLDVRVIFDAGAARDGDLPGLANLTNDMLLEGSANYNVDQIAAHFEQLGAHIDTSSHRDMAIVQLRSLAEEKYLQPAISVFSEVIAEPSFPESSFTRNKKLMLIGLEQEKQSPQALISKLNFERLYPNHPYGIPPNGTEESIFKLTKDDLKEFHQRYYVAQNAIIAMVGNISRAQAERIANQITGALPKGQHAPLLPQASALTQGIVDHIDHPTQQTHILVSTHSITRSDDLYMPLYVGNEILGGSGFASILNEEIRQKRGLSYSIYSYFSAMRSQGPFIISLQTKSESADEALILVQQNLREFIDKGPTQEQLDNAIRNITNSFPLNTANNSSIVSYLGSIGFYDLPLDYLDTFTQKIGQVTIEDIKKAFKSVIDPDKMVTLTLGPTATKTESINSATEQ